MAIGLARIRIVYFLHEWPSGKPKYARLAKVLVALLLAALLAILLVASLARALLLRLL